MVRLPGFQRVIPALLLSLSLHHHGHIYASRLTCYQTQRQQICVKTPVLRARHEAYGVWTNHGVRYIHGRWRRVTLTFPILRERFYTVPMLITYYDNAGVMADGTYTYPGAAACGYDLPTGAKLHVAGVPGVLTCHDREGAQPWHHVDIWEPDGYAAALLGLGMDTRLVTVYV